MATKKTLGDQADAIDSDKPWNTPLSDAPKKAEPTPPRKPLTASQIAGEPQEKDYVGNPVGFNLAKRKWAQKETK